MYDRIATYDYTVCVYIQALAKVLKINSSLAILNLESNRITRKGIKVRGCDLFNTSPLYIYIYMYVHACRLYLKRFLRILILF